MKSLVFSQTLTRCQSNSQRNQVGVGLKSPGLPRSPCDTLRYHPSRCRLSAAVVFDVEDSCAAKNHQRRHEARFEPLIRTWLSSVN